MPHSSWSGFTVPEVTRGLAANWIANPFNTILSWDIDDIESIIISNKALTATGAKNLNTHIELAIKKDACYTSITNPSKLKIYTLMLTPDDIWAEFNEAALKYISIRNSNIIYIENGYLPHYVTKALKGKPILTPGSFNMCRSLESENIFTVMYALRKYWTQISDN